MIDGNAHKEALDWLPPTAHWFAILVGIVAFNSLYLASYISKVPNNAITILGPQAIIHPSLPLSFDIVTAIFFSRLTIVLAPFVLLEVFRAIRKLIVSIALKAKFARKFALHFGQFYQFTTSNLIQFGTKSRLMTYIIAVPIFGYIHFDYLHQTMQVILLVFLFVVVPSEYVSDWFKKVDRNANGKNGFSSDNWKSFAMITAFAAVAWISGGDKMDEIIATPDTIHFDGSDVQYALIASNNFGMLLVENGRGRVNNRKWLFISESGQKIWLADNNID